MNADSIALGLGYLVMTTGGLALALLAVVLVLEYAWRIVRRTYDFAWLLEMIRRTPPAERRRRSAE